MVTVSQIRQSGQELDAYFSVDVETDGPIPGPYSILSLAFVFAGTFDGSCFDPPSHELQCFYSEMRPISGDYEEEALRINGLDRKRLVELGDVPASAMDNAYEWIMKVANGAEPVLVAYPLSLDWSWVYWYFTKYCKNGSPFNHSRCFDLKTAYAVKARIPISEAGRSRLMPALKSKLHHSHHALDDAIEQAEIFAKVFLWEETFERASDQAAANFAEVPRITKSPRKS